MKTKYTLTVNHASSSHGIPVLVDESGTAYGKNDFTPEGLTAGEMVNMYRAARVLPLSWCIGDESLDVLDPLVDTEFTRAFTK